MLKRYETKGDEFLKWIRDGKTSEGLEIEFKEEAGSVMKTDELAKDIISFANLAGGKICFGISNIKDFIGVSEPIRLREKIQNVVNDKCRPALDPAPVAEQIEVNEKKYLILHIEESNNKPHYFEKNNYPRIYLRADNTSRPASIEQIRKLFEERGKICYDKSLIQDATFEEFDQEQIQNFLSKRLGKNIMDITEQKGYLINLNLVQQFKDSVVPTLAGFLILSSNPWQHIPHARIRLEWMAFREIDEGRQARVIIEEDTRFTDGHLCQQIDETINFIKQHSCYEGPITIITGEGETDFEMVKGEEYPENVLREIVTNAVVHRDWGLSSQMVTVRMERNEGNYKGKIEIESPGGFIGKMRLEDLYNKKSFIRNHILVESMRTLGYAKGLGIGIITALDDLRNINSPEPFFQVNNTRFKVTILGRFSRPQKENYEFQQ